MLCRSFHRLIFSALLQKQIDEDMTEVEYKQHITFTNVAGEPEQV